LLAVEAGDAEGYKGQLKVENGRFLAYRLYSKFETGCESPPRNVSLPMPLRASETDTGEKRALLG